MLQVNQFVQAYLGDTDDAKKFVKQFVEKQTRIQQEVAVGTLCISLLIIS